MIARADFYRSQSRSAPPAPNEHRTIRLALLGCGTVGGAVARLLIERRSRIRDAHGIDVALTHVLVRDIGKARDGIDASLLTADLEDVLCAEPDIVIEALGGREPAATFIERALRRGICVVSANKTVIAHDGPRLHGIARRAGATLAYEASVGAAIPVLAALRQRAVGGGDPVLALRAVLNGTCNFILSRMRETGESLEVVLREAIKRGLAEPDPTADISGRDTAEKLCVLARAAGFGDIQPGDIATCGIEQVTPRDLDAARERGCVVRVIAELEAEHGGVRLRVGPALVPQAHPLAKARGAENVIVLEQEFAGRLTLQGEGAGPRPTAAAILGDVLGLLRAADAPSSKAPAAALAARAGQRRCYVRTSRVSAEAAQLRTRATDVQVRRDSIEAIVQSDAVIDARHSFVAPVLA